MSEYRCFENVAEENCRAASKIQSAMQELKICELDQLANDIACAALESFDGLALIDSLREAAQADVSDLAALHGEHLEENEEKLGLFVRSVARQDRVALSSLVLDKLKKIRKNLSESDFFDEEPPGETVAFVKNPLSDEAFDVFSLSLSEPRLKYAKTMRKAAEMLSDAEADFCLLPLEERNGVRIVATSEILFRDDLKINDVTTVLGQYGDADMKFALVSPSVIVPHFEECDAKYLEIRIEDGAVCLLSDIIDAAECFGAEVHKINTMTFDSEEGSISTLSVIIKSESRDLTGVLTYLSLFAYEATIVGIYKNLE